MQWPYEFLFTFFCDDSHRRKMQKHATTHSLQSALNEWRTSIRKRMTGINSIWIVILIIVAGTTQLAGTPCPSPTPQDNKHKYNYTQVHNMTWISDFCDSNSRPYLCYNKGPCQNHSFFLISNYSNQTQQKTDTIEDGNTKSEKRPILYHRNIPLGENNKKSAEKSARQKKRAHSSERCHSKDIPTDTLERTKSKPTNKSSLNSEGSLGYKHHRNQTQFSSPEKTNGGERKPSAATLTTAPTIKMKLPGDLKSHYQYQGPSTSTGHRDAIREVSNSSTHSELTSIGGSISPNPRAKRKQSTSLETERRPSTGSICRVGATANTTTSNKLLTTLSPIIKRKVISAMQTVQANQTGLPPPKSNIVPAFLTLFICPPLGCLAWHHARKVNRLSGEDMSRARLASKMAATYSYIGFLIGGLIVTTFFVVYVLVDAV